MDIMNLFIWNNLVAAPMPGNSRHHMTNHTAAYYSEFVVLGWKIRGHSLITSNLKLNPNS